MEAKKRIDPIKEMQGKIKGLSSYIESFKEQEKIGKLNAAGKKMLEEAVNMLAVEEKKLEEYKQANTQAKQTKTKTEPVINEKVVKPKAHKKNEKFDVFTPFTTEEELATATVKQMRDRKYDILSPEFRKVLDRETAEKAEVLEKKIAAKNGAPAKQEKEEQVEEKQASATSEEEKVETEQSESEQETPIAGERRNEEEEPELEDILGGDEQTREARRQKVLSEQQKKKEKLSDLDKREQEEIQDAENDKSLTPQKRNQLIKFIKGNYEKLRNAIHEEYPSTEDLKRTLDLLNESRETKNESSSNQENGNQEAGLSNITPEPTPEPENPFRVTLDGLRSEYATKYHNFYKERNKKMGLMNKIRRGMGMSISNEPPIPQELIDLKNQYEKSIFEYGNDLYNKESVRLGSQNLSPDQIKIELDKYKSEVIFKDLILDEEQKLANQKVEDLPMKEKSALGSFFAWYNKLPTWQKRALSIGAVTGVGFAAISMAGAGVAGASVWAGAKILRATTGALVGEGAAYAVGKMATGEINRAKESGIDSSKNVLENLNWDENTFNHAKNQYQQTLSEHAGRMNSIKKKQMYTKILAGGLTTFALNYEDAFIHKPSMHDLFGKGAPVDEAIKATTNTAETVTNTAETATQAPATEVFNVQVSSEGAIRTVEDLKEKLATQFPNKSIAPANIQHILNTNATELSKEWGLFNPDDASGKESATMLKGSTVTLDSKGNITLHNLGKGDTILSGEGAKVYGDEMFDSDHNANNGGSTRLTEGGGKVNINEIPGEHLTEGSVNINEIPGENSVGDNLSLEKEINNIPQSVRDAIVPGSATGASTDVVENIQNQGINLNGHSVEEFNAERIAVLDKSYSRWFSTSGAVAKSAEWDHLQNQSMDKLANPGYDFANTREERLIKHLVKLASREGIDYGGKTATQLVDALAIKNLG